MIRFLASQGLGASNLPSVIFREGHGGIPAAKMALDGGYPAVTIRDTIYVNSSLWSSRSSPSGGSTFFEEILHTIQWRSGDANFGLSWVTGSLGGWLLSGDPHNSPLEIEAGAMANQLLQEYRDAESPCPD